MEKWKNKTETKDKRKDTRDSKGGKWMRGDAQQAGPAASTPGAPTMARQGRR